MELKYPLSLMDKALAYEAKNTSSNLVEGTKVCLCGI